MEITGSRMLRGAAWVYFGVGLTAVFGFLTNVFLARLLDAELWGLLSVVLIVVGFLGSFALLGLKDALTYYVAYSHADRKKASAYAGLFFKYDVIVSVLIALFLYLFSAPLAALFNAPQAAPFIQTGALYLFALNLFTFFYTLLSGLGFFKQFGFSKALFSALNLLLAPLLVFYGFGVTGALLGFTIAAAVSSLVTAFWVRRWFSFRKEEMDRKDVFFYGLYSGIAGSATIVFNWADFFLIGLLTAPVFVGFYRIAFVVSAAVSNFISSSKFVLFPALAGLEAEKRREAVSRYFNKSIELGAFFGIPATVGLAILAYPLTGLFFGSQFLAAAPVLVLMSFACIDAVLWTGVASAFGAFKKQALLAKIIGFAALINIIMNVILIPLYGIVGAAFTNLFTKAVKAAAGFYLVRKKCGLAFDWRCFLKPAAASVPMAIVLYASLSFISDWLILLTIPIGIGVYSACQFLLGFNFRELTRKLRE